MTYFYHISCAAQTIHGQTKTQTQTQAVLRLISMLGRVLMMVGVIAWFSACTLSQKKALPEPKVVEPLKKKIVVTAFYVHKPAQVMDWQDVSQSYPRVLAAELEKTSFFLMKQSPYWLSYENKPYHPTQASQKIVQQVANEHNAQFVLTGEIVNAGIHQESRWWSLTSKSIRHIELKIALYDGITGQQIKQFSIQQRIEGAVELDKSVAFGSESFYETQVGKSVKTLNQYIVSEIQNELKPFPMMVKIIKVNDQDLVLDAGMTSGLQNGMLGSIISRVPELPNMGLHAQEGQHDFYGHRIAAMGSVKLFQLTPTGAYAMLQQENNHAYVKVKEGDYVRFVQ